MKAASVSYRGLVCSCFLVLVLGLALGAQPAWAADFTVQCGAGDPPEGVYTSIGAALAAIAPYTGHHTITVSGECVEEIRLVGPTHDYVTIQAPEDSQATIRMRNPPTEVDNIVRIAESARGVKLRRLRITGGGVGLFLRDSEAAIGACTIDRNRDGIQMERSTLRIEGEYGANLIQDNNNFGLLVGSSAVRFSGSNSVERNNIGVQLTNTEAIFGQVTVRHNAAQGILARSGSRIEVGGGSQVRENGGAGVHLTTNSNGFVGPNAEIAYNQGPGIQIENGATLIVNSPAIVHNSGNGMLLLRLSVAFTNSPPTFSGNGGAAIACDDTSVIAGNLTGIFPIECKNATVSKSKDK